MGGNTSSFSCEYTYTPQDKAGSQYTTSLECAQYRRPPYNVIPDRSLRRTKRKKRATLVLGDTLKVIIHNFILDNINKDEPHGAPGDPKWTAALLKQIQLDEKTATEADVRRWVRNHRWIKKRHCQFRAQKRGTKIEPQEMKGKFAVQHVYKPGGKGKGYTVDLDLLQLSRLPNNFIPSARKRRVKSTMKSSPPKKAAYTLRPRNPRSAPRSSNQVTLSDTHKLIIHNFTLENVHEGEPNGIPGEDKWISALTKKLREQDPRVTEDDVLRWLENHCWIIMRHNEWTCQGEA